LKAAMDLLGLAGGAPRPPLLPADRQMHERLQQALSELGLLDER
jgi:dihydrodipicolinate synthase/N-acetylneuraminate lyase